MSSPNDLSKEAIAARAIAKLMADAEKSQPKACIILHMDHNGQAQVKAIGAMADHAFLLKCGEHWFMKVMNGQPQTAGQQDL